MFLNGGSGHRFSVGAKRVLKKIPPKGKIQQAKKALLTGAGSKRVTSTRNTEGNTHIVPTPSEKRRDGS